MRKTIGTNSSPHLCFGERGWQDLHLHKEKVLQNVRLSGSDVGADPVKPTAPEAEWVGRALKSDESETVVLPVVRDMSRSSAVCARLVCTMRPGSRHSQRADDAQTKPSVEGFRE